MYMYADACVNACCACVYVCMVCVHACVCMMCSHVCLSVCAASNVEKEVWLCTAVARGLRSLVLRKDMLNMQPYYEEGQSM